MYAIKVHFSKAPIMYYDSDYFYTFVLRWLSASAPYKIVPDTAIPEDAKIYTGKGKDSFRSPCREVEPEEIQAELFGTPDLEDEGEWELLLDASEIGG